MAEARTAYIPADLSAVTSYVPDQEVDPVKVGMHPRSVQLIWEKAKTVYRTGYHPAFIMCIRRRGEIILNRALGHAHGNGPGESHGVRKEQATPETPICLFSASKAMTAVLIHMLNERGEVDLKAPVCEYIPEYKDGHKKQITVEHVLSHRSGFPFVPPDTNPETLFEWVHAVELIKGLKLNHRPGTRTSYHAITGGHILGEILHRVTGKDIRDFWREEIQQPMGLPFMNYGASEEDIPRIATNYVVGPPMVFPVSKILVRALGASNEEITGFSNEPRFYRSVIPAGNMVGSAEEVNRVYQMLLNGGEYDGRRYLQPETVARLTTPVSDRQQLDYSLMIPMRYTLGMMTGNRPVGMFGPRSEHAWGHLGYLTIFTWADPSREISVSILNTGKTVFGAHFLPMMDLLATVNRECRLA